MGSFRNIRNGARSSIGRNWGRAKQALTYTKNAIDAGHYVYQNLKPIINEGVQAFGNTRVKDSNTKAQGAIETGIDKSMQDAHELTSHVDKIDDLANQAFTTFAYSKWEKR